MRKIAALLLVVLLTLAALAQDEAQSEETPILELTVAGDICGMALVETEAAEATPEATAETGIIPTPLPDADEAAADYPVITLGEDCETVLDRLHVPRNGTLWLVLSVPDEAEWQQFELLEDDDYPPILDRRGRFIGCANPNAGEQLCRVLWMLDATTYLVEIPIFVGDAFTAPPVDTITNTTEIEDSSDISGEWGICGSCSTCDGVDSVCVLAPDGVCVADPGRCAGDENTGGSTSEFPSGEPPPPPPPPGPSG